MPTGYVIIKSTAYESPVWAGAQAFPSRPLSHTDRRDARYARGCQRLLHLNFHPDHSQEGPGQPFGRAPRGRAPLQLSSWPRATARTRVPTYTPTPRQVSASHPPLETKGPTYARTRAPYSHPHQGSLLTPTRGPYLHPQQGSLLTRLRQQARDRLREARVLGAHLGRVRVGVRVRVQVRVWVWVRIRVWVRVRVRIRVRIRVRVRVGVRVRVRV